MQKLNGNVKRLNFLVQLLALQSHCRSSWPMLCSLAHWQGLEPTLYLVLLNLHTDTSLHNACTLARAWICFYSLLEQHKSHTAWIYSLLVSAYCKPCLAKDMLSACWQCHFVTYALQVATLDCKFMDTIQSCFVDSVRVLFDCGDGVTFFRPLLAISNAKSICWRCHLATYVLHFESLQIHEHSLIVQMV